MSSIILGIIFLIICYIGIGLYYSWPYLLVGAGVIVLILLVLYFTVGKRECRYCGRKYNTLSNKPCPSCDGIDFKSIETVDIIDCEETYRIEEERNIVSSYVMDGVEHVGYETVRHHIPNGLEYTFLIYYYNGTHETRVYHESSRFAQRLITISENSSLQKNVADAFTHAAEAINNLVKLENDEEYEDEYSDENLNEYADLTINDFVVLNIDTTGLNNNYLSSDFDEIISVSIIDENGNVLLDKLCDTECIKNWDEAQRFNGISPDDVRGLPTFRDILKEVLEILSAHRCVIGYNILFELQFIRGYVNNNPDAADLYKKTTWRLDLDVMEMYKYFTFSDRWAKLEAAAKNMGYSFKECSSLEDAKATLYIFNRIREEEFRKNN